MNNSLERLIDGMAATLRTDVIPHIEGDYARGQAFGVIYMLNSLKLRASWSNAFLLGQLQPLQEAGCALGSLAADLPGAPLPAVATPKDLPEAAELQAARDEGDAQMCALIDWLAAFAAVSFSRLGVAAQAKRKSRERGLAHRGPR